MRHDVPPDQHGPLVSIALHLLPGVLIGAAYFGLRGVVAAWGAPSLMALMLAIALVLVPLQMGYLVWRARSGMRAWREGVVSNLRRVPAWHYLVWVPLLIVVLGAVFTVMKPVDAAVKHALFAAVPTLDGGLREGFTRSTLIWTYAMVALWGVVVGPAVEELYFRGHLLPRMAFAGRWALPLHGLLFALYHVWTPWMVVTRAVAIVPLAWVARHRSLYLAIATHVLVNSLDMAVGIAFIVAMG